MQILESDSILQLDFKKLPNKSIDLNDENNLKLLKEYILPVIVNNEGWGTGYLTEDLFYENPTKYQTDIDATVYDNVHVYLQNRQPVAILEYEEIKPTDDTQTSQMVRRILQTDQTDLLLKLNLGEELLNLVKERKVEIYEFLKKYTVYQSIGLVLRQDLQGKKTGISEKLYSKISNGILLGYTSNPIIIRQRRKLTSNTFCFPMFTDDFSSLYGLAAIVYAGADILTNPENEYKGLEYGALYSELFIAERGEAYIQLAEDMHKAGKITENDARRIKYVLSHKECAGAIISFPD